MPTPQLKCASNVVTPQVEVLYQIADVYALKGDTKRAMKMLHLTYDFVGAEPNLLARLGTMHATAHDRDEALRYYLQSYEQLPSMDVLALLCAQYVHDERYETAAAYFVAAAGMQPGEPKWALMAASCHYRAQKVEHALELYEQVRRAWRTLTRLLACADADCFVRHVTSNARLFYASCNRKRISLRMCHIMGRCCDDLEQCAGSVLSALEVKVLSMQIHERFPDNLEALRYLVQLSGELQEQGKRDAYEVKLQKVERVLAMREDIPKPTSRQAERSPSGATVMLDGRRQVQQSMEWGLGGEALLPEGGAGAIGAYAAPANGGRMVSMGAAGQKEWDEELGADLLPGLD